MKQKILLFSLIAVLIATAAGGTAAYFNAQYTARNVITAGNISIELLERMQREENGEPVPFENQIGVMPNSTVSKIVSVKNTGENSAWVRVSADLFIELAQGNSGQPDLALVHCDFNLSDWVYHEGYYYYGQPLQAGEESTPLLTAVTFDKTMGDLYQNATATISMNAQAVQTANNGQTALTAAGWPEEEGGAE